MTYMQSAKCRTLIARSLNASNIYKAAIVCYVKRGRGGLPHMTTVWLFQLITSPCTSFLQTLLRVLVRMRALSALLAYVVQGLDSHMNFNVPNFFKLIYLIFFPYPPECGVLKNVVK